MIANERQYRISSSWLARFEQARADVEKQDDTLHPRARQAFRDQYDSQIEELRAQLEEYNALRRGEVGVLELDSLRSLPEALIRARAAAGLSQEALAARLGRKKQQVQRWEATRYAGVDLERLQTVVDALGARISEQVVLPVVVGSALPTAASPPLMNSPPAPAPDSTISLATTSAAMADSALPNSRGNLLSQGAQEKRRPRANPDPG